MLHVINSVLLTNTKKTERVSQTLAHTYVLHVGFYLFYRNSRIVAILRVHGRRRKLSVSRTYYYYYYYACTLTKLSEALGVYSRK